MELTIDIGFNQLVELVQQLPAGKIVQLKSAINDDFIEKKAINEITDFQKFLLDGPVMTDEQYESFLENRKHFNEWRTP